MSGEVMIRPYRPGDLADCRALWEQLTDWHRQIYASPGIGGPEPGLAFDDLLARAGASAVWVAEVDGECVGLTGLLLHDTEGELEPLVVARGWRGGGIGHLLAAAVEAAAREAGLRRLVCRPAARNRDAIRFFNDAGFDVLGQLELIKDFTDEHAERWRGGERLADSDFRV